MDIKKGYKETEIGVIPEEWEVDVLENNANILMGQSPLSKYYNSIGEGIPFMQGRKTFGDKYPYIDKWCTKPKRIARKGSVLMSVRAPVGDLNIANRELCIGRGLASLEMKNKNNEFLYYLLKNYNDLIIKQETGTVFGSISKSGIENLKLPFPPLNEQKAIADILSSLDDKIEVNNQINKTLEEIAQAIFKHWFIDFEFPNEEGKPYKSSGGEMIESELGLIPKGWEVKKYIDIADIQYGYPFKSKLFNDSKNGFPIIRIRDINKDYSTTYTTEKYSSSYVIKKGDILVGMDGEFKAHIWKGKDVLLNQRILRIREKRPFDSKAFIYFSIIAPLAFIENYKTGTTVKHLGKREINEIKVIVPNKKVLKKFKYVTDGLIEKMINNTSQNILLSSIRDTLLPKLMSGEIRVV